VLRVDNNAAFVRLGISFARLFTGRYALQSGKRLFEARWKGRDLDRLTEKQRDCPVELVRAGKRVCWMFRDCFYWDDEDLEVEDVKALVLLRIRKRERQLATAHSLMRAEENGFAMRVPVPVDVRRAVFERDGMLLAESPFVERDEGEHVFREWVRYRTVGDMSCTGAVASRASTLDEVVAEIAATRITERGETRADDRHSEAAMEDRKVAGYF